MTIERSRCEYLKDIQTRRIAQRLGSVGSSKHGGCQRSSQQYISDQYFVFLAPEGEYCGIYFLPSGLYLSGRYCGLSGIRSTSDTQRSTQVDSYIVSVHFLPFSSPNTFIPRCVLPSKISSISPIPKLSNTLVLVGIHDYSLTSTK